MARLWKPDKVLCRPHGHLAAALPPPPLSSPSSLAAAGGLRRAQIRTEQSSLQLTMRSLSDDGSKLTDQTVEVWPAWGLLGPEGERQWGILVEVWPAWGLLGPESEK